MRQHILTITILLLSLSAHTFAQSRTDGFKEWNPKQTLAGLRDIGLIVKYDQADGLETAMQPTTLQVLKDRARDLLTQGEVPLLQSTDEADMIGRPRLVFTVTLKKQTDIPPALLLECKLFQRVRLWRDPAQEMELATWKTSSIGPKVQYEMLSTLFDRQVEAFVNAYRAVNPPQGKSRTPDPPAQLKDNGNALQGLAGIDLIVSISFVRFAGKQAFTLTDERYQELSRLLQSEAENKVTQAGIPLLRYTNDIARAGYPLLNVVMSLSQPNSYAPAIDAKSEFWQRVRRVCDPEKQTYAVTLESRVNDGPAITDEALRRVLNSQLDLFIAAYKTANPRLSLPISKAQ